MSATMAITTEALADTVSRALRRSFSQYRYAAQKVADLAHGDARAARNWMDGSNPPNAATLLTLMRECPDLRAEINRLLDEKGAA